MTGVKRSVVVLAVAALGCGGNALAPGDVPYGQPFDLKVGESARVGDDSVGVTFEAVKSDSRCPIDAICVHAGEAVVALRFAVDGETLAKDMGTEHGKSEVVLDRYSIRVVSLQPYPRSDRPTAPGDYVAQLRLDSR
jgi:hypothetical protein